MENYNMEKFNKAVLMGEATWWQMELPSGGVFFGDAKAEMLGYSSGDFNHYKDFTSLVHKDDYEKIMQDMRDHIAGKKNLYETTYRIKNKKGEYIRFYDCGQIISKDGEKIVLMGFVWKIKNDIDVEKQMTEFRKMILDGSPSIMELVAEIK